MLSFTVANIVCCVLQLPHTITLQLCYEEPITTIPQPSNFEVSINKYDLLWLFNNNVSPVKPKSLTKFISEPNKKSAVIL